MQTILRSSDGNIRATFTGGEGEAVAPVGPKVTITRDSDGEVIESATAAVIDGTGAKFKVAKADTPTVDLLRATWAADNASAADTEIGVVGGFLCSLEALDAAVSGSSSATILRALREAIERKIEDACNVAFRPSYYRESIEGDGTAGLLLRRPMARTVLAATLDGDDIAEELSVTAGGLVARSSGFPKGSTLSIAYSHGWTSCPEPITRAAVALAATFDQGGDDRVTRFREDDQEFFLSLPGLDQPTGIPEVDRAIQDYSFTVIG